jgi:hypothetical protein
MTQRRPRLTPHERTMHLVISFIPLLRAKPGTTMPIDFTESVLMPALESEVGHVRAVVWADFDSGAPWPVLVLDHANEILEHLAEWAEGSPADWFTLIWTTNGDRYALALMPRVDRSVERYRTVRHISAGEEVPSDATFHVAFKPILFRGPMSASSRAMLRGIPQRVRVGFLDRDELPADDDLLDPARVVSFGPIEAERDRSGYLRRVVLRASSTE